MAHAEILIDTGDPDGAVFEHSFLDGPDAIRDGSKRFKDIMNSQADWMIRASMKRDFNDNLSIHFVMRIGPWPKWSKEYLETHDPPWLRSTVSGEADV